MFFFYSMFQSEVINPSDFFFKFFNIYTKLKEKVKIVLNKVKWFQHNIFYLIFNRYPCRTIFNRNNFVNFGGRCTEQFWSFFINKMSWRYANDSYSKICAIALYCISHYYYRRQTLQQHLVEQLQEVKLEFLSSTCSFC